MEWARSSISAGTDRIPAEALTTIGKNAMRNAMITLDVRPNPNHTSSSGANAICGTSWEATSSGYTAFSNGRQVTMATVRDNDGDAAETARYLELPLGLVQAAISYYSAYRDEIDQWTEANEQQAAEAHAAWSAGQDAVRQ